jgi:ubiquinone/menaquinone biosynthesis C-methylase UbiE
MLNDPYRQMFLAGNAASAACRGLGRMLTQDADLLARLEVPTGGRLLLAGVPEAEILPSLRISLGLTGQLVILDPSSERLSMVPRRDADWAVLLKAPPTAIPNLDASLDAVLCWGSFLDLDHHYLEVVAEMFRVLSPGGKALIAETGPGAPLGPPRPCPMGMAKLFIRAGFSRMSTDEGQDFFLFKAEKVAGFEQPVSRTGWA